MENTAKKKEKTYQVNSTYPFLSLIFSDTSGNGHANPAFKLKTPQEQRKVREGHLPPPSGEMQLP